jgi:hypothetical protein
MSASAEVPPSILKKKSTDYVNTYEKPKPESLGFPKGSGIFKQTSTSASEEIPKEKPSVKALTLVSNELSANNIYHPSRKKKIGDISNVNQTVSPVSSNVIDIATKSQKKTSNQKKNWFSDEMNIRDADYVEMVDEIHEMEHDPRYVSDGSRVEKSSKKVPKKVSVIKRQAEPPVIQSVLQKRKTRSKLVKKELEYPEPSEKDRSNNNNDRWLIDAAFDQVYGAGKAVVKATRKAGKIAGKAVKQGIREFNEISELACENPILKQIGRAHENDMRAMASQARHARNSIAATGNNSRKKSMTAGSLITQRGLAYHQPNATVPTNSGLKVIPRIVFRKGNKDVVLYFLENGQQITRAKAQRIQNGIIQPNLTNNASTTNSKVYRTYNTTQLTKKPDKNASSLVTRSNNTTVNKPKNATPSKLVTRHRVGV